MKFLRVGRFPSRKPTGHNAPKPQTRQIRIRFPVQLASDRALANQLRAEAESDLAQAIEIARVALKISATPQEREHANWFLESLRKQVPPPSKPARERHASAECHRNSTAVAGGVFL